jgi:RNA polymerase sigma-70 factor (ECF subfamily)
MKGTNHNGDGFSAFLRLHQPRLRNVAMKFCRSGSDADDLVQDTMERALIHFAQLAPLSPNAQRAWLVRTLSCRFIDICRHRGKEVVGLPEADPADLATLRGNPAGSPRWEHITVEDLRKFVDRLPPFLAKPFQLRSSGQSYKTIAQELGASEGTVASWLFQARHQLRKLMMPFMQEEEINP